MGMKLDRWIQFGNCLVGYLFDCKKHPAGARVVTGPIRFLDIGNFEAECVDGKYKLGEPGTVEEHNRPLMG